jgi:hypothetical protein
VEELWVLEESIRGTLGDELGSTSLEKRSGEYGDV